jgi:hypothetical protein
MRGFEPQKYADGGLVQGVKRLFGMDEERNARVAAYRAERDAEKAKQQAAQAQAQAPAPAPAVTDYAGMGAMKRREKAAGLDFANGGMVRGPGTGTSDDVPDEVSEGTYIMPADSTEAVGADKLADLGSKKVPVNLSNGEFKLPPEQVHAVGVQALDQMKDATHQPVRGFAPEGESKEPPMFFADGGAVFGARGLEGLRQMIPRVEAMGYQQAPPQPPVVAQGSRNVADLKAMIPHMEAMGYRQSLANGGVVEAPRQKKPGIFPGNSPDAGADIYGASNKAIADGARGAAGFVADAFPNTTMAVKGAAQDTQDAYRQGGGGAAGLGAAVGQAARVAATPLIGLADDVAGSTARVLDPLAQGLKTFVTGDATPIGQSQSDTGIPPAARPAAAVRGPLSAASNPTDQRLAVGTQSSPMGTGTAGASPAAPTAAKPGTPESAQVLPGVYRSGNSFSDSAQGAVEGVTSRGQPTAQNMAAADALAGRQQLESMSRLTARGFAPVAGGPGSGPVEPGSFTGGYSGVIGTDPSAGRERRELMSALTTPVAGARGLTAAQRNGVLQLMNQEQQSQQARDRNATSLQQTRMQGDVQRETASLREAGDTGRAVMREQGESGRANARNSIDSRRVAVEEQARGFDIRQGQRQEKLYERYDGAKTAEERAAVAKQIRDLSGKGDGNLRDNFMTLGGGQEWDTTANTMRNVPQRLVDLRTGQEVGQNAGRQAPPAAPADDSKRVTGQTYTAPNGQPVRWTGSGWLPA